MKLIVRRHSANYMYAAIAFFLLGGAAVSVEAESYFPEFSCATQDDCDSVQSGPGPYYCECDWVKITSITGVPGWPRPCPDAPIFDETCPGTCFNDPNDPQCCGGSGCCDRCGSKCGWCLEIPPTAPPQLLPPVPHRSIPPAIPPVNRHVFPPLNPPVRLHLRPPFHLRPPAPHRSIPPLSQRAPSQKRAPSRKRATSKKRASSKRRAKFSTMANRQSVF